LIPADVLPWGIVYFLSGFKFPVSNATEAVAWALERDLPISFNFYRENSASSKSFDNRFEEKQIIEGMRAAFRVIENNLPKRPFLEGLLDTVRFKAHQHTCGAGQSYLVFTPLGQVVQCPMSLDESGPTPNSSDPLEIITKGNIPVINVDDKEGCRDCRWRYLCAGGCPLETHRLTGRFDIKSPHCNIYQSLIPEVLRLEGLRLMKEGGFG